MEEKLKKIAEEAKQNLEKIVNSKSLNDLKKKYNDDSLYFYIYYSLFTSFNSSS